MAIGYTLDEKAKERLFKLTLSKGAVFLNHFPDIDHPIFFIVAELSQDKVYTCCIYQLQYSSLFDKKTGIAKPASSDKSR